MSANKRLTIALPIDVWNRLHAEAKQSGKGIGTFAADLLIARDERKNN